LIARRTSTLFHGALGLLIVVLYVGAVAEAGSVDRVIRDPKHPYTRLLISSIPLRDRKRRWGDDSAAEADQSGRASAGCRFAPRCPAAMERCWSAKPALYLPNPNRTASCFLYGDSPVMPTNDLAQLFGANGAGNREERIAKRE
jgi:peptide/nickel transport system ATP-binding protein